MKAFKKNLKISSMLKFTSKFFENPTINNSYFNSSETFCKIITSFHFPFPQPPLPQTSSTSTPAPSVAHISRLFMILLHVKPSIICKKTFEGNKENKSKSFSIFPCTQSAEAAKKKGWKKVIECFNRH